MTVNPLVAFVRAHPIRFWVSVFVTIVLFFAAYTALRVVAMAQSLQSLSSLTDRIGTHAASGDVTALAVDLREVRQYSTDAANTSNEWVVVLASHQPIFGTEIGALRVVSTVASDLSRSASPLVELLPRLTPNDIAGEAGFDLALIKNLDSAVGSLSTVVNASSSKLKPLVDEPMVGQLHNNIASLSSTLELAGPGLERVVPFIEALPVILGANGERTWFVMTQNLTEARPSGGLLSAYVVLNADNGKLDMVTQGSNDTLEDGPSVSSKTMPQGLKDLWGDYLNSWLSMNLSADFPTNARQITDGWNARDEQQVDGVVSLGQGTVQYLAAAVGPITVRGTTIQPSDMVRYLSVDIYKQYQDATVKDEVLAEIIGQIFEKLSAGEFNVQSLVTEALSSDNADYLQLWSTDKAEQLQIENSGLSGSLTDTPGPVSSVRIINAGGNKLDAYLALDAEYDLGRCVVDDANSALRSGTVTVTVTNNAPASGLPPYMTGRVELEELGEDYVVGSNHSYVEIYMPVDAVDGVFTQDGEDAFVNNASERNHEFAMFDLDLDPGESSTIVATWQEPGERDDGMALSAKPTLSMQPLLNEPKITVTSAGGSCR